MYALRTENKMACHVEHQGILRCIWPSAGWAHPNGDLIAPFGAAHQPRGCSARSLEELERVVASFSNPPINNLFA